MVYGTRLSMVVGGAVLLLSFAGGIVFGLLGGLLPALDNVLMRIMDGLMAFPGIILAIALMASLGPSVVNVIVALGVVYVPRVARIVRGSVLVIRETPYVEAALALGVPILHRRWRHVLPNCTSPGHRAGHVHLRGGGPGRGRAVVPGRGRAAHILSWGNVLAEGRSLPAAGAGLTLFPGAAIMACILGLNLFGDGLRDLLDPKMQGVRGAAQE